MINWKIVIIGGIAALLISFFIGALAGNPFGVILLRAIIFGIAFAGISGGINYVIERFIPEVYNIFNIDRQKNDDESKVDIVIPQENPHNETGEITEPVLEDGEDIEHAEEIEVVDLPTPDLDEKELNVDEDNNELVKEESKEPEVEVTTTEPEKEPVNDVSNGFIDIDDTELDVLPQMDSLEGSFSPINNDSGDGKYSEGNESDFQNKIPGKKDPSTLAKAVRTIIKRDER